MQILKDRRETSVEWALAIVLSREDDLAKMKVRLQVSGPDLGVSLALGMCGRVLRH